MTDSGLARDCGGTWLPRPDCGQSVPRWRRALAPQLDAFVEAVSDEALPERPKSFKGESLREKIEFVCGNAVRCAGRRVIDKAGFAESEAEAERLCADAGIDFADLALVAVKSPATMTDNDAAPADERTVTLKEGGRCIRVPVSCR